MQPTRALQALGALLRDPDDTAQVFTLIESLSSTRTPAWIVRRLEATSGGTRLLRERPEILDRLVDRAALRGLPADSLAHAYLRFVEDEGITAEGLREASVRGESGERDRSPEVEFIRRRLRDAHDLWHTVLGYRGDLVGEAAVLAFTFAQTRNPALGTLALLGLLKLRTPEARAVIAAALVRGLRAAWLPGQRWESLLPLPLAEVRTRLAVGAPPAYAPIRSSELRAAGFLG